MAYETSTELKTLLQEEVGDTSPTTDTATRYLNLLDLAHKAVVSGGRELNLDDSGHPVRRPFIFPWATSILPKTLVLPAPVADTATVTKNSASVTITTNSASTDLTGYHFRVVGTQVTYYISLHSGTTLTLDSVYVDSSGSGVSCDIFKLIHTIGSDVLLPTDKLRDSRFPLRSNQGISFVDRSELLDQFPVCKVSESEPQLAGVLQHRDGTITLQLSHYPSDMRRLELQYIAVPSALTLVGSNPIIPKHLRTVIVHLAAFYHLRKRDDDRANSHLATARQLFDSLTTEAQQIVNANDDQYGYLSPWGGNFEGGIKQFVSIDI